MGCGFGYLAARGLAQREADAAIANPLLPKRPHFAPRAKRVIFVFMQGGPSHVDTFDPKEALKRLNGKSAPTKNLRTERPTGNVMQSPYKFRNYGECGLPVSEIFANTAQHMDEICVTGVRIFQMKRHKVGECHKLPKSGFNVFAVTEGDTVHLAIMIENIRSRSSKQFYSMDV